MDGLPEEKALLLDHLARVVANLHRGNIEAIVPLLRQMHTAARSLSPQIQLDIHQFIIQVEFQMDYDPFHLVTEEIQKAADALIKDLGVPVPKKL